MKVTVIGTGNVAKVLGKLIYSKGYSIVQVYGRNKISAIELANSLKAEGIDELSELNNTADIYIIAVADKAIAEVCVSLNLSNKIVLHTAGSVNKNVLENVSQNFGVLYPIQSITKNFNLDSTIPFLIDASNEGTLSAIENFSKTLSSIIHFGNDEQRMNLHIAAVFANNFVNYMYFQSAKICEASNLDFSLLQPLIEETAFRIRHQDPNNVVTGPAKRKDTKTLEKHRASLKNQPQLLALYNTISNLIMES